MKSSIELIAQELELPDNCFAWMMQANTWEMINDNFGVERCLKRSEELAIGTSDYIDISKFWRKQGKNSDAMRCVKMAENTVQDDGDWRFCEEEWAKIGEYSEAQKCKLKSNEIGY